MDQTKKIIIFESVMCCAGGNCGSDTDKSHAGFQDAAEKIKKTGVSIERYSITQNLKKFIENPDVMKLIKEQQLSVLPITMVNGNVIKTGSYPTENELAGFLQDNEKITTQVDLEEPGECCSGKDHCAISCGPQYRDSGSKGEGNSCCC